MARQFFVGGNFKMNPVKRADKVKLVEILNKADLDPKVGMWPWVLVEDYFVELIFNDPGHWFFFWRRAFINFVSRTEVVIAPPTLYLIPVADRLTNTQVKVSAQNCYFKDSGAFTGEISPAQLADTGIPYVILGHSERRSLFHESSADVAQKTAAALQHGLKVILCCGETLEEREADKTLEVVQEQVGAVVKVLKPEDWTWAHLSFLNRTLSLIDISKECGDRIRARVGYRHWQSCNLATGAGRACCSPIVSLSHCLAWGSREDANYLWRQRQRQQLRRAWYVQNSLNVSYVISCLIWFLSNSTGYRRVPRRWCLAQTRVCRHHQCQQRDIILISLTKVAMS